MSNDDLAKRILESKTRMPEHQRLDVEPKAGGRSLLHDEFGMLKVSPTPKRQRIPVMKEISQDPVVIKAKREPEAEDNFFPPKSNFVSVGNVDHAWYDDKVTGVVDNNEVVDTEKLQGINPLADASDPKTAEAVDYFTKRLNHLKALVVAELPEITEIDELKELRAKTFGKKGIFTDIMKQISKINGNKAVIGALVNQYYSEINTELQGKEFELSEDEDDEVTEWPEDMAVIEKQDEDEEDNEEDEKGPKEFTEASPSYPTIPEGYYAVIIDSKITNVYENVDEARDAIGNLLINESLEFSRIELVKRLRLDFGIIVGE